MGFYADHILPRAIAVACGSSKLGPWRSEASEGLIGEVFELGFGSGSNIAFYPPEVTSVVGLEPSGQARKIAERAIRSSPVRVDVSLGVGEEIPFESESFDSALMTFVLCSVADPEVVLAEIFRVLKSGSKLNFLEHGISDDQKVSARQHRLDPLQVRLGGGCHLVRNPPVLISRAGFEIDSLRQDYGPGPRPWSYLSVGSATKP